MVVPLDQREDQAEQPARQRDEPDRIEPAVLGVARLAQLRHAEQRSAPTPIGMLTRKIQRHESHEVSIPPASGPIATAAPIVAPQSPNAVPRSLAVELLREQRERGREHHRAADPLDAAGDDQEERSFAAPQAAEAIVKRAMPSTKSRLRPKRSASAPAVRTHVARASA